MTNIARHLKFSDEFLSAVLVEKVEKYAVEGIVLNLSSETIRVVIKDSEYPTDSLIRPWRSTTILQGEVLRADRIIVIQIKRVEGLGGVMLRGWKWYGDISKDFPQTCPLFVSPSDVIGIVQEDAAAFTGEAKSSEITSSKDYEIIVKCWWTPNETDCGIHNDHSFLEIHTQIYGVGRMQKFKKKDPNELYEEVMMVPGFTHEAFCRVQGDGLIYPWHRYYTDKESIWMAIELHPKQ